MSAEQIRKDIAEKLPGLSNLKRLRGGADESRRELQQLYDQATEAGVPQPWLALCAYRLAHLVMWSPNPDYEEADALFVEAGRAKCLGPRPHVYRLAAAARARAALGQTLSDSEVRREFDRAIQALRKLRSTKHHNPRVQDEVFNLLELAAYFTNAPLDELSGLGDYAGGRTGAHDRNHQRRDDSFVIVTNDPISATVACTRAVAEEELEARAVQDPEALCFELAEDSARWKPPGQADWVQKDHRWLRLLTVAAIDPEPTAEDLRRRVMGADADRRRADNLLSKIRERMSSKLGREVWSGEGSGSRLAIPVIGVVHWGTFQEDPDSPRPRRR
jgi:hypothetical protein